MITFFNGEPNMSKSLKYQVVKLAKENLSLRGYLLPLVTGKTANDDGLRLALTKLAYENPSLRSSVLPLVKSAMEHNSPEALKQYLKDHPNADKKNHSLKSKEKSENGGEKGGGKKEWKSKLDTLTSSVSKQESKVEKSKAKLERMENEKDKLKEKQSYWTNEESIAVDNIVEHPKAKKLWEAKDGSGWSDLSSDEKNQIRDIKSGNTTLGKILDSVREMAQEDKDKLRRMDRQEGEMIDQIENEERKLKKLQKSLGDHKENEPAGQGGGGGKKKEKPAEETSDNSSAQPQSLADKKKAIKDSIEKRTDLTPKEKDAQKKALEKMNEGDIDKKLKAMGDDEEEVKTSSLKHQLVRLAHSKPHLRKHILPLLK